MLESLNEYNQYYTVTITPLIPRYTQLSKHAMTHMKRNERIGIAGKRQRYLD